MATSEESVNLLIVDPAHFAEAAAWGSPGGPVSQARRCCRASPHAGCRDGRRHPRKGVAAEVPVLLVGDVGDLDLDVGSQSPSTR